MSRFSKGNVNFRDYNFFNFNDCNPDGYQLNNTGDNDTGGLNTFDLVFRKNLGNSAFGTDPWFYIKTWATGKLEMEVISLSIGGGGTQILQYAKIIAEVLVNSDLNTSYLQNVEMVEYRDSGILSANPMQVSCYPGSSTDTDFPMFQIHDGSDGEANCPGVTLVRCRFLGMTPSGDGVAPNADYDSSIIPLASPLNPGEGDFPSGYAPLGMPTRGVWNAFQTGSTDTPPNWIKTILINSGANGTLQLYLNPAASYKAGETITIKDAWGMIDGTDTTFECYAYSGDAIEIGNNDLIMNSQYDSVTLMTDGVNNWMIVGSDSKAVLGDTPGCQPVEIQ